MSRTTWRRVRTVAFAVFAALVLTGCGAARDLDAESARAMQTQVLAISQAVAATRLDSAEAAAHRLREQLEAAVDDGLVSASRYRTIDEALDTVLTEIAAAREAATAAQVAAEQAAADQAAAEQAAAEQAAAEHAAAERAAAEAAAEQVSGGGNPAPGRAEPEPGKGNNGNGKGGRG